MKVWPGKEVESGITVKNSIIWGSQGRRVLFGQHGVSGAVNIDLTPEFAARLGAAFGATLPKGSLVTINRDPHRSPRMLKRAIISGLPSSGVNVWDLGTQPIPVARYFTSHSEAVAGVTVRVSPYDERIVDIRFMDSRGVYLDDSQRRRVEQRFFREDFGGFILTKSARFPMPQKWCRVTRGDSCRLSTEMRFAMRISILWWTMPIHRWLPCCPAF